MTLRFQEQLTKVSQELLSITPQSTQLIEMRRLKGNHRIQSQKGAVQRWILAAHKCAEIVANMHPILSPQRSVLLQKEYTKKRKYRDEAHVCKAQSIFKSWGNQFWYDMLPVVRNNSNRNCFLRYKKRRKCSG